jgi:DNA-binding MarR family transcriptional regulator
MADDIDATAPLKADAAVGGEAEHLAQDRMAHLVRYVARGVTRSLQLRLADHGVQFGGWVFLRILWKKDGLSQRELSKRAGLMEPTTHTALRKLEALGYLTRKHPPGDRKRLLVYLTKEGKDARKILQPLAEQVNETSLKGLSQEQIDALRAALLAMAHKLDADEAAALRDGVSVPATRSHAG